MSIRERTQRWGDLVLALALLAEIEYEVWVTPPHGLTVHGGRAAVTVLVALVTLPLVWRRRAPIAVVATSGAAVVLGSLLTTSANGPPLGAWLALLLGFYSVGAHCEARRGLIGGGAVLAALAAVDLAAGGIFQAHGSRPGTSLTFAVAFLVGREVRRHRREVALLRDRAARLEQEREERARTAAAEERARIARELHDVVAHSVSVMVVQAQAAAARARRRAAGAARDAARLDRDHRAPGAREMRRLLGLLRRRRARSRARPAAEPRQLDDLVEQVATPGCRSSCVVEGEPRGAAPGVDLSAYRIVQEALTNALKHAGPAQARVTVRYAPGDSSSRSPTTATGGAGGAAPGTAWSACASASRCTAASSRAAGATSGGYAVRARLPLGSRA